MEHSGKRDAHNLSVNPEHDPIQLEAADWVGRLSNSNVSLDDTLAWQDWMKADARHAKAFYRFEQISQVLKLMGAPARPWSWQLERDRYDGSVALSDWRNLRQLSKGALPGKGKRKLAVAAALVLSLAATTYALFESNEGSWNPPKHAMTTGIGENRRVDLPDGSVITLGGSSRLEWSFTPGERSLELAQGEALFKVAHDPARPFLVRAGDATVVALGTVFNVHRSSDHTVVAVTDGRVIVEPVEHIVPNVVMREFKPKLRPVHVDAGEQTTAGIAGIENASQMEDMAAATSWETGRLSFRQQPLRYVLEDVNRYSRKPINASDERVGSLVVSGTVMSDNIEAWVQSLEHAFGLVAVEDRDQILLREPERRP
jgi:transmembrane sensor